MTTKVTVKKEPLDLNLWKFQAMRMVVTRDH